MTRYQTYQLTENGNWCTIDTKAENPPEIFFAGPFDVTLPEADMIENTASIVLNEDGTEVTIIPNGEA